jgi:hypothetical protein
MKIRAISLTAGTAILAAISTSGTLGAPARGSHHTVVDTTAVYAKRNGDKSRVANVDCVQASRGHYMCSYVLIRPSLPRECHLLQATWSPGDGMLYAVTLAGRVPTCGTLREALRSLR